MMLHLQDTQSDVKPLAMEPGISYANQEMQVMCVSISYRMLGIWPSL